MAQVKLLEIGTDGIPTENAATDDVTFASYTVSSGGPVLSATGLNLNTEAITGLTNITFVDPTTDTINQTAGTLIINNIMAKERTNLMTTAGKVQFPVVTDTAGTVDLFRLPAIAGVPTATPTAGGTGELVWDSTDKKMYVWDGSAWDDQSIATEARAVDTAYTAGATLTATQALYISAADNVSPAKSDAATTSQLIGFAVAGAASSGTVQVRDDGALGGFSALTAGSRYYLSGTTAGAITTTVDNGSGHYVVQAGYAKNTTTLQISIEQLGRRA